MDNIPLSVVRISDEEQELLHYWRLLPRDVQEGIALMIAGNMPSKPAEQVRLSYADPPRLVSSK